MCSVVLCARVRLQDVLTRQIASLCLTNHRQKHMKTRAVFKKVKVSRVERVASKPIEDPWSRTENRGKTTEYADPEITEGYAEPGEFIQSKGDLNNYVRQTES